MLLTGSQSVAPGALSVHYRGRKRSMPVLRTAVAVRFAGSRFALQLLKDSDGRDQATLASLLHPNSLKIITRMPDTTTITRIVAGKSIGRPMQSWVL
jgi:hypothetical protein